MEFTLYYRGDLKANRGAKDKHLLRQHFHKQLKELWNQSPLSEHRTFLDTQTSDVTVVQTVGNYQFAPLVSSNLALVADLTINLLRPEAPGAIITQSGDIDNRLKTLLDALKMPNHPNAIPSGASPSADEFPFFCLLEDDNLITSLNVQTDRFLEPNAGQSEVVLLIHVRTRLVVGTFSNLGLV